jgi:beta-lactam-binding protein with PASTA domain
VSFDPNAEAPSVGVRSDDGRQGLFVVLDRWAGDVAPGTEWTASVRITNTGTLVERVDVRVEGFPDGWAVFEPPQVNLDQGQEQQVLMRVRPPHDPGTTAGPRPFVVSAWSMTNPAVRTDLRGSLTVGTFASCTVEVDPPASATRRDARLTAIITNHGNVPLSGQLRGREAEGALRVHPPSIEVTVPPGRPLPVELHAVAKHRQWTGVPRTRRLFIDVTSAGAPVAHTEASVTQNPVLPSWATKAMAAAVVLLLLGTAAGVRQFLATRPRPVPAVVGKSVDEAQSDLVAAGFAQPTVTRTPDPADAGTVTAQDPAADALLGGGQPVALVVSSGPAPVDVPDVVGMSQDAATQALAGVSLVAKIQTPGVNSPTVAAGAVVSQDPPAHAQAGPKATVTLTLSLGPEMTVVPTFTGLDRGQAQTAAASAQLVLLVGNDPKPPSGARPGLAYRQDPAPNTPLAKEKTVTVWFAPAAPAGTAPPASGGGG